MTARLEGYQRQLNWLDDQINMLADNFYAKRSGHLNSLLAQRRQTWNKYQILQNLIARNPERV